MAARRIPPQAKLPPDVKAPPVLLPYQQAWIFDQSPVKICEKSRRVGLSWAEASDDTLFAASAAGDDVWYIGYNKDMAEEFIKDCAFWAQQFQQAAGQIEETVIKDAGRDILTYVIKFAGGNRVTALSSRPTNLRGKQGRVVIDEAAFHDDLPGLLKAAFALLIWGGQVRVISTHLGDSNPFNELIQDCRAGRKPYSVHRITFAEALDQGLYQRICLKMGKPWSEADQAQWAVGIRAFYGDDAEEELDCVPSQGSGVWLPRSVFERCMRPEIPVLRWACGADFVHRSEQYRKTWAEAYFADNVKPLLLKLDKKLRSYAGEDFGRTVDLTVIWPAQEAQNLSLSTPFILELRNVPFEQQKQIVFMLFDSLPRFSGAAMDARGNGQYLAEVAMQKYGANRILQVMPTEPWYRDNMPKFKARWEDASINAPRDSEVLDDLRAVRVTKGVARVPETRTKGKDGKRHGDAAIAGCMLCHAVNECEGGEVEHKTASKRDAQFKQGCW